ncbi:DMT family transporter [Novosphingobium sp.]|uniref:DMT family transporter n=1 Tax=Novosphingobium sp. TaxID=1874826 RepID=UPI0025FE3F07|nr:DMT family transporter [Novosphingobium sp.]
MTAIWLPAALLGGLFQAWRTAIQQRLRAELTVSGAGLVRYAFGAPVALVLLGAYLAWWDEPLPGVAAHFWPLAAAGGLAQILGTNALIAAFGHRGFVVGTAFSKTEALQAALVSFVLLGERLGWLVWAGIGVGVAGVTVLGTAGRGVGWRGLVASLTQRGALLGLASGGLFALTGVLVKLATQQIATPDHVLAALVALVVVMAIQTMMHGTWVAWREPATWRAVWVSRRTSAQVGLLAALGSACWFTGFATAPVALVRVVGQIEVFATLAFGHFYLREPLALREAAGLLLVAAGVALALVGSLGH